MTSKKNFKDILESIDALSNRGGISRQRAFAAWYAIQFFEIDEDDALESAAADGGNDQGIDIVFADHRLEEMVVIQAHCPENLEKKTPKAKWDALVSSLPYIRNHGNLVKAGRPDLAEQIKQIKSQNPGFKISAGLITLGAHSDAIKKSLIAHKADSSYKDVSFFYLNQDDIHTRYQSLIDAELGIPEDTLEFSGGHFEDEGEYGRSWVGSISSSELQRLHSSHENRLFAGNVRLYLGSRKGGINEQIIKTAENSPGNFWALNNGITIVADSVSLNQKTSKSAAIKGTSLTLRRFSIVNGCQTTSSLVRANANQSAKVLARVIAARKDLKNEIVRYNNSQNSVKIWTVRAVDDIQERLRKEFAKSNISYAPKQSGSRRKKDGATIELDKVTQYLASAEQDYLIQAINNKSELFDQPYQHLFGRDIGAPDVYLAWLVGNFSEEERKKLHSAVKEDESASLLGVASSYWIIFSTYRILASQDSFQRDAISLEKMLLPEFQNALRKYATKATEIFYEAAIDTYEREEYGSIKSCFRSNKFLQKISAKLGMKAAKLKGLPNLTHAAKSAHK
ncbi:AIPR family protein [Xanthomonas indica]|uniref:AIPR family protein n=1 Tax=Xanthomonas indica TaxID=2912242 RepID=A0AAU8I6K2_9XANT|nr:AIPR family protein [Xanthomonas indica]MCI2263815.1 AIPR family protein [Xanthomonas indica]